MRKQLLIVFAFVVYTLSVQAQFPLFNYQSFGYEEGLNNTNIFSTVQHPGNGLIYFTTQNGIYSYDGYSFQKLNIDSLKNSALLGIAFKNNEELYISIKDEGVAIYNIKSGKYSLPPQLKFKNNSDNFIITDSYAYMLNSGIGLTVIDTKTGKELSDKKTRTPAYCLFKTKNNTILIGKADGLFEVNGTAEKKVIGIENKAIHSIAEDYEGKIYAGSSDHVVILNKNSIEKEIPLEYNGKVSTFLPSGERNIEKLLVDNNGRFWFSSSPGDNLYMYQNNTVYNVFELLDIQPSLINSIFMDRKGNLWIGTFNDGAYFIQNSYFNSYNFTLNKKQLNINSVLLKGDLLVTGTNNGLYALHLKTGVYKSLSKPDPIISEPIGNIQELDGIIYYARKTDGEITPAMFADSKSIYKFKPLNSGAIYPINNQQMVMSDRFANLLLIRTDNLRKDPDTLISFPDYRININVVLRTNDSLLVATNNGLFIYDFKNKSYDKLTRSDLNFTINDLAKINGQIYVAHEAGISNLATGELIENIGKVKLNSVKKIKVYDDHIWLATLNGVLICDNKWEPLKIINKNSGLLSNYINDISFSDDRIAIATSRGVAVANVSAILKSDHRLDPVTIDHIKINGSVKMYDGLKLNLSGPEEDLQVFFHSPVYAKPNKQFYRFRIDNGEWNPLVENSLQRIIEKGNHSIEISASIDNINWSNGTVIEINKEAKLSESSWIYLIITIIGLLLISAVSFVIIKRIKANAKKRLEEEKQVNLLKHQAMNALLSPHFIFNSLTSIQNYINTNNTLKASEYLAKFSRLIRMIIEKAAQSDITLQDELSRLNYYLDLEKERFKNKFDFTIEVDPSLNSAEIKIPNMIIQPHVENCIIHGILPKLEHGKLSVNFKRSEQNKLLIEIEDDGIGLIKAKEHAKTGHKSLGTSTIKNILEINSKLSGKKQNVNMVDKSTLDPSLHGTLITIEIEL